jgi:hypothetical protein
MSYSKYGLTEFLEEISMRISPTLLLVIVGTTLVVAACTPNRLRESLETPEPDEQAEVAPAAAPGGRRLQPQLGNANIDLAEVVTLLPPDAIPAVLPEDVSSIMVTAQEAENAGMDPSTRVLGVSINGDSRAYPVPYMSQHEIVNDEVGGEFIAATW